MYIDKNQIKNSRNRYIIKKFVKSSDMKINNNIYIYPFHGTKKTDGFKTDGSRVTNTSGVVLKRH